MGLQLYFFLPIEKWVLNVAVMQVVHYSKVSGNRFDSVSGLNDVLKIVVIYILAL